MLPALILRIMFWKPIRNKKQDSRAGTETHRGPSRKEGPLCVFMRIILGQALRKFTGLLLPD